MLENWQEVARSRDEELLRERRTYEENKDFELNFEMRFWDFYHFEELNVGFFVFVFVVEWVLSVFLKGAMNWKVIFFKCEFEFLIFNDLKYNFWNLRFIVESGCDWKKVFFRDLERDLKEMDLLFEF